MRWRKYIPDRVRSRISAMAHDPSKREAVLGELNALDLFGKVRAEVAQERSAKHGPRRLSRAERALRADPDLAEVWHASEPDIAFFGDREAARALIAGADADTLHEIANRITWDGCSDLILQIARHPDCDHATAWAIYHLAAPDHYEAELRKVGRSSSVFETDADIVAILDAIVARFREGGFATRRFPYHEDFAPDRVRGEQRAARARGEPLHWELPDAAYAKTEDAVPEPRHVMVHGDGLRLNFLDWMAART